MNFINGDKVRITDKAPAFTGYTGTVIEVYIEVGHSSYLRNYRVKMDKEVPYVDNVIKFLPDELELIKDRMNKFEVGDEVWTISSEAGKNIAGEVIEVNEFSIPTSLRIATEFGIVSRSDMNVWHSTENPASRVDETLMDWIDSYENR